MQTSIEINDPYQYPSNGLPIWHGLPDIRPIEVGASGANITLTPTAVKINWTNMATKTTSHSTLVETKLGGTQPIYEQLMWEIKLYSHVAVMPRAWGITATCMGHNRHQL